MKLSLEGKVAIVTGASRGIGRAIAERLAGEGAAVVVNHRASAGQAADVVAAIESAGGRAVAVPADMGVVADVRRLVNTTLERFGRLDILINNAGVGNRTAMADMTEKEFDWTLAVNARGPFFAIQAAVPRMSEGGRIINISSCGTHVAQVTGLLAVYQMSKGALEQLARCYMKELGARGDHDQLHSAGLCGNGTGKRHSRGIQRGAGATNGAAAARDTGRYRGGGVLPGERCRALGNRGDDSS